MTTAAPLPLRFQVGARTLLRAAPRRCVRVPLSLADALRGRAPALPPLDGARRLSVTSLPERSARARCAGRAGMIAVRAPALHALLTPT